MHIPPNWGTFFALIVSFLVFWFIFSRLFFRPFLNLLSERERRFKDLNDRTEQLVKEARAADEERERRLGEVTHDAKQPVENIRGKTGTVNAHMRQAAR